MAQFKKIPITNEYDLGRQLGTGKFSVVRECTNKANGKTYAVKMITKKISEQDEVLKEIEIMRAVDEHPNVIHLIDVFEDAEHFNLVLELVTGGELFDKIVEYEFYSEKEAAKLVHQIASLVAYLHNKNIVHRDLKPENLLFADETATTLKLCDFGLADYIKPGEPMMTLVGSPTYMAPEILDGAGYGKPVDLYSIGVVMYILLCGYPPFEPEEGITELDFPSPEWDLISQSGKTIIAALLNADPAKRPTANELLDHPWVRGDSAPARSLVGTIRTMKTYNTVRRNPGETMRKKDGTSKGTVFNLFDNPPPTPAATPAGQLSPRAIAAAAAAQNSHLSASSPTNSVNPSHPTAPLSASTPTGPIITVVPARDRRQSAATGDKDKKAADKKTRRKTGVPQPKPGDTEGETLAAKMGFSFGDASLKDLSKKVEQLGGAKSASSSPAGADKSKEILKLSEALSAERKHREQAENHAKELQHKLEAALKAQQDATHHAAELEEKMHALKHETDNQLQTMDLELKKRLREASDAKLAAEKHERLAAHSEAEFQSVTARLEEALKKLAVFEQGVKIENLVAERLESKKIQDLTKQLANAQADTENEAAMRKLVVKEKDSLDFLKRSLEKQVGELKKQIESLEEEKTILKCKLEAHS